MIKKLQKQHTTFIYRTFSAFLAITFICSSIVPPSPVYAQTPILNLPVPGAMVPISPVYTPTMIKGILVDPTTPLQFDFILDSGDDDLQGQEFEAQATKLIKYFLASLTLKEEEMWVNLSPYEKDRIIPDSFGQTEMGRDLLAQDYLLKQLTASLMYPEDELGKKFWDRIYAKAKEEFGSSDIPVDTFNKVWIVPESANVFEHEKGAYVVDSYLKVMLEKDYQGSGVRDQGSGLNPEPLTLNPQSELSKQIIKDVVLPEIEREVNEGKTFANLRQIYHSMILATWYKQNLKESLLAKVYVNKNRTDGVNQEGPSVNRQIYDQYIDAFKNGVYNYIKEDIDPTTNEIIPRKYFSGGVAIEELPEVVGNGTSASPINPEDLATDGNVITVRLDPKGTGANRILKAARSSSPVEDTLSLNEEIRSLLDIGFYTLTPRPDVTFEFVEEDQITYTENSERINNQESAAHGMSNLQFALIHLIENAVKYSKKNGKVEVRLKRDNNSVIIQISDQGIGIPLKDQTKVGKIFHRARNARWHASGSGRGFIAARIMLNRYYGGSVELASAGKNQGTTVTVRLPDLLSTTLKPTTGVGSGTESSSPIENEILATEIMSLYRIGDSKKFRDTLRANGIVPDKLISEVKEYTTKYLREKIANAVFTPFPSSAQKRVFQSESLDFVIGFEYDILNADRPPTDDLPESFDLAYQKGGDIVGNIFYIRDVTIKYLNFQGREVEIFVPYLLVQEKLTEFGEKMKSLIEENTEESRKIAEDLYRQFIDLHRTMYSRGIENYDVKIALNYGVTKDNRVVLLDTGSLGKNKATKPIITWFVPPPYGMKAPDYENEISLEVMNELWESDLDGILRSTFVNPDLEKPLFAIIKRAVDKSIASNAPSTRHSATPLVEISMKNGSAVNNVKAVILDWDETTFWLSKTVVGQWQEIQAESVFRIWYGSRAIEHDSQQWQNALQFVIDTTGMTNDKRFELAIEQAPQGNLSGSTAVGLAEKFENELIGLYDSELDHIKEQLDEYLMPGVLEFLKELKHLGVPVYVSTSNPFNARLRIHERLGLDKYIAELFGPDSSKGVSITKSEVAKIVAKRHKNTQGAILNIGDSEFDFTVARDEGAQFIAVIHNEDGQKTFDRHDVSMAITAPKYFRNLDIIKESIPEVNPNHQPSSPVIPRIQTSIDAFSGTLTNDELADPQTPMPGDVRLIDDETLNRALRRLPDWIAADLLGNKVPGLSYQRIRASIIENERGIKYTNYASFISFLAVDNINGRQFVISEIQLIDYPIGMADENGLILNTSPILTKMLEDSEPVSAIEPITFMFEGLKKWEFLLSDTLEEKSHFGFSFSSRVRSLIETYKNSHEPRIRQILPSLSNDSLAEHVILHELGGIIWQTLLPKRFKEQWSTFIELNTGGQERNGILLRNLIETAGDQESLAEETFSDKFALYFMEQSEPLFTQLQWTLSPEERAYIKEVLAYFREKQSRGLLFQEIDPTEITYTVTASSPVQAKGSSATSSSPVEAMLAGEDIYTAEYVEQAQQLFDELLRLDDERIRYLIENFSRETKRRASSVYNEARILEKGYADVETLKSIHFKEMVEQANILRDSRKPNKAESRIIDEAGDVVREYFLRHDLPFREFSDSVYISSEQHLNTPDDSSYYDTFSDVIVVAGNLNVHMLVHEIFHFQSIGFPIDWLNEGLTEYLTLKALMEHSSAKYRDQNLPGPSYRERFPSLKDFTTFGPVTEFMLNSTVPRSSYLPPVSLMEYLWTSGGVAFVDRLIDIYLNGQWPEMIDFFGGGQRGEEAIIAFEKINQDWEVAKHFEVALKSFTDRSIEILSGLNFSEKANTTVGEKGASSPAREPRWTQNGDGFERVVLAPQQARYVPSEILALFEIADTMGIQIALTGGTARDFSVYSTKRFLVKGQKGKFPALTDFDIAIPITDEEMKNLYNESAYKEFERLLREQMGILGFGESTIDQLRLDHIPGYVTGETYVFENMLKAVNKGDAFSISRLAVTKDEDGNFVIFGVPQAIEDLKQGVLDIWIEEGKFLAPEMITKMLGKSTIYNEAIGFEFNERSRTIIKESILKAIHSADFGPREFMTALYEHAKIIHEPLTVTLQKLRIVIREFDLTGMFNMPEDALIEEAKFSTLAKTSPASSPVTSPNEDGAIFNGHALIEALGPDSFIEPEDWKDEISEDEFRSIIAGYLDTNYSSEELQFFVETRKRIKQDKPDDIRVYYPGIGPYWNAPIDIVTPLLSTDFTELVGAEIENINFTTFKVLMAKELLPLGITPNEIAFEEIDKISFSARFTFNNKTRTVHLLSGMDAQVEYPADFLEDGADVVYMRHNFKSFHAHVNKYMLNAWLRMLRKNGLSFLVLDWNVYKRNFTPGRFRFALKFLKHFKRVPLQGETNQRLYVLKQAGIANSTGVSTSSPIEQLFIHGASSYVNQLLILIYETLENKSFSRDSLNEMLDHVKFVAQSMGIPNIEQARLDRLSDLRFGSYSKGIVLYRERMEDGTVKEYGKQGKLLRNGTLQKRIDNGTVSREDWKYTTGTELYAALVTKLDEEFEDIILEGQRVANGETDRLKRFTVVLTNFMEAVIALQKIEKLPLSELEQLETFSNNDQEIMLLRDYEALIDRSHIPRNDDITNAQWIYRGMRLTPEELRRILADGMAISEHYGMSSFMTRLELAVVRSIDPAGTSSQIPSSGYIPVIFQVRLQEIQEEMGKAFEAEDNQYSGMIETLGIEYRAYNTISPSLLKHVWVFDRSKQKYVPLDLGLASSPVDNLHNNPDLLNRTHLMERYWRHAALYLLDLPIHFTGFLGHTENLIHGLYGVTVESEDLIRDFEDLTRKIKFYLSLDRSVSGDTSLEILQAYRDFMIATDNFLSKYTDEIVGIIEKSKNDQAPDLRTNLAIFTKEALPRIRQSVSKRIEFMNNQYKYTEVNLQQLITTLINDSRINKMAIISDAHLDIPNDLTVEASENMLAILIEVLIQNTMDAYKGQRRKSTIEIKSYVRDKEVIIEYKDQAGGVNPDIADRIFELDVTSRTKGTGLGLALAKKIAEDHNGSIVLDNSYGQGATFVVSLPQKRPATSSPIVEQPGGIDMNPNSANSSSPVASKPGRDIRETTLSHNGAKLLTRLSVKNIERLKQRLIHWSDGWPLFEIKEDEALIEIRSSMWRLTNSSLATVNSTFNADIVGHIMALDEQRRLSADPDRTLTIVDIGAGAGTALKQITQQLRSRNVTNIRLVAYGHAAFKEWLRLPKEIEVIFDRFDDIGLYFTEDEIDFAYSHWGLTHEYEPKVFQQVVALMRKGGELLTNLDWEKDEYMEDLVGLEEIRAENAGGSYYTYYRKTSNRVSSPAQADQPGGIDMNPNNLELKTQGGRFEFDLPMDAIDIENIHIDGFTPVIINVAPLTNLPLLLGLVDEEESEETQQVEYDPGRDPIDHKWELSALN